MDTKDLRKELNEVKGMIQDVNYQVQELRKIIRRAFNSDEKLPMFQHYEHPWYKHIREGSLDDRVGEPKSE
tara:strand:- start:1196 stop:1408 length:213 start_codon:yes stop_codon:yes gene_type:complete